jgi:phosphoglycerol transferase MdoB-like AlkP superfamily enzyme
MSEEFKKFESLVERLREYVNTRVAQVKLSVAEKISKVAALMIALLMAALVFFLFLVLASVAGAIAIGQQLNNMWLGFLIMAGIILVFGILLWALKDKLIRIPIMNALVKALFEKEDNGDEEK